MSSWGGVEAAYGTNKPFLHQFTQYEFLSNDTTLLHPIDFEPTLDGSVQAPEMFAPLPTGTTTTIAAITAGTRTNTNTNWIASPTTGSFAAGTFIVNTTHPGAAWAWKLQSGASWHLSQPMARTLNPPVCLTRPGEVTTWAAGDTITYYSDLVHVNIVKLLPTIANMATNESTLINVHGVRVTTPGPTVIDYLTANQAVTFQEARSDRVIDWLNNESACYPIYANDYLSAGIGGWTNFFSAGTLWGGVLGVTSITSGYWHWLDADVVIANFLGATPFHCFDCEFGRVYIDTGITVVVHNFAGVNTVESYLPASIWGPGALEIAGSSHLNYAPGATSAATKFVATMTLDGQSLYCVGVPSAVPTVCNHTLTGANLDSDFGAGVTGCAFVPGGASMCNYASE
jgi:hypothetical protein